MKMKYNIVHRVSILLGILLCFLTDELSLGDIVQDLDDDDNFSGSARKRMINFASHQAGAVIVDKSPSSAKGFNNLLNDDRDKYGICSCNEKKWVVIGLSEEIAITAVAIANYEKYSSTLRDFQLLGSLKYPTSEWNDLGSYTAQLMLGEQYFNTTSSDLSHTRYLKIKFLSHYLDEDLCTLSQIKVYGQTVFATLQEEVARSEENDIKLLLQDVRDDLQREDWLLSNANNDLSADNGNESNNNNNVQDAANISESTINVVSSEEKQSAEATQQESLPNTGIDESQRTTDETTVNHNQDDGSVTEAHQHQSPTGVDSLPSAMDLSTESPAVNQNIEQGNTLPNLDPLDLSVKGNQHGQDILDESASGDKTVNASIGADSTANVADDTHGNEDRITVEHESSGQVERLHFNQTEWNIINGALQRSNLTVDFLKSTIQSIKQFFVDPLSQRMDVPNLERFISTQQLPTSADSDSISEPTETGNSASADDNNASIDITDSTIVKKTDETVPVVEIDTKLVDQSDAGSTTSLPADHENILKSVETLSTETTDTVEADARNKTEISMDDSLIKETSPAQVSSSETLNTNLTTETEVDLKDSHIASDLSSKDDGVEVKNVDGAVCNEILTESSSSGAAFSVPHDNTSDFTNTTEKDHASYPATTESKTEFDAFASPPHVSTSTSTGNTAAMDGSSNSSSLVASSIANISTHAASISTSVEQELDAELSQQSQSTSTLEGSSHHSSTTANNTAPTTASSATSQNSKSASHTSTASWVTCLDQLKFGDFQGRMLAKLQHKNGSASSNTSSTTSDASIAINNNNHNHNNDVAGANSNNGLHTSSNSNQNNNNIFKQIIQRMKSLETNQAITEIYLAQLSDCLRLMRDEMVDRQQAQDEHDIRAQQNPLSALFSLSLMATNASGGSHHRHHAAAGKGTGPTSSSTAENSIVAIPTTLSPFLLPLLSPPDNQPFDAFWSRMLVFTKAMIRITVQFVWIVVLAGRQEQAQLLTNTLQELRHLLQTSVVEFWCALVCGLVISLLLGGIIVTLISVWLLIWCCCQQNGAGKEEGSGKKRFIIRND